MNEFKIEGTKLIDFLGDPETTEVVEIPPGITHIGPNVFCECDALVRVLLPESVTVIERSAFEGCCSLEYIHLPENLERIEEFAFSECRLLSSLDLPHSLTDIGEHAFSFSGLKALVFPGGVDTIKEATCAWCDRLERVWILPGVSRIKAAFYGCSSLKYIQIPDSVQRISASTNEELTEKLGFRLDPFHFCKALTDIDVTGRWAEEHSYLMTRIRAMVERAADECRVPDTKKNQESVDSQNSIIVEEKQVNTSAQSTPIDIPSPGPEPEAMDPELEKLLNEAVYVISHMLEIGSTAAQFSDIDYEGFIIVVPDSRPPFSRKSTEYGFIIKMVSVSDLSICRHKYPHLRSKMEHFSMFYDLDWFADRYHDYYDPSEEGYVYRTTASVTIPKKQKKGEKSLDLRELLYTEVARRCPLADFAGTPIHTKGVYH